MPEGKENNNNTEVQDQQQKEWQKDCHEKENTPDALQKQLQKSEDMNLGKESQKLDDLRRKNSDSE